MQLIAFAFKREGRFHVRTPGATSLNSGLEGLTVLPTSGLILSNEKVPHLEHQSPTTIIKQSNHMTQYERCDSDRYLICRSNCIALVYE